MEKDENRFKLSKEDHELIYKLIEKQVFKGKNTSNAPIATVLGGQPGSGKFILINESKSEFEEEDIVIINGDEYRRMHPKCKEILRENEEDFAFYTDADVRIWTARIFDKAINDKYNFIFEGTMRNNRICDTLKRLKENGFYVKVKALSVNGIDSSISTIERYEAQKRIEGHGRMAPTKSHKAAYYGMLDTLKDIENESCFDELKIFNRNKELIYFNNLKEKNIYSKYNLGIYETLIKNRDEIKPSMKNIEERLNKISEIKKSRGEELIKIEDILKNIEE